MPTVKYSEPNPSGNATGDVARGVTWAVFMRWCIRLIGLVSTVILARLLSPEDFGVAAMGMLFIGFLVEFTSFGTEMHLIRSKEIDRAHCDTAWTINLLQGATIAVLIGLLAIPAADYFHEPRVVDVMYIVAFTALLGSFENIGITLARRDLQFALDFRFNVYKRILIFFTTVSCAFLLRNYWALVIGHLAGTAAGVALSYRLFPYRPSWCLERAPEYLRFALSIMPMRMAFACHRKAPALVVGGLGNTTGMGSYTVASSLSEMFTSEIVIPMGRGLFPNYARLAGDRDQLSQIFRSVLGLVVLLCIPLGVGLSAVAHDLVATLLGGQWVFAAPLVKYLALGSAMMAIGHTMTQQILVATGREHDAAILAWLRVAIALPLLVIGATSQGALGVSKAVMVAPLLYMPFVYLATRRAVDLPPGAFFGLLWRPLTAAAPMYLAVRTLHPEGLELALIRLLCDVSVGAVVFVTILIGLWCVAGQPAGAEQTLLRLASGRLKFVRALFSKE